MMTKTTAEAVRVLRQSAEEQLQSDVAIFWAQLVNTVARNGEHRITLNETSLLHDSTSGVGSFFAIARDISEQKQREAVMEAQLRLMHSAASQTLAELLRATLDEAEALTRSQVGFYHFLAPDQVTLSLQAWSTNTAQVMCKVEGVQCHYPLEQAGVWAEAIHLRRAVIHNDYASLPNRKGLPEGHAPVIRELVVPIMRGDKIVALLGVGNKPTEYDEQDIAMVTTLADQAWEFAEKKLAESELQESNERFNQLAAQRGTFVWEVDAQGLYTYISPVSEAVIGYLTVKSSMALK